MIDDTEARIEEKEKEILRLQEEIEELKERELQD
jgi:peptidoglycan hydrolase CwlO-like protein